MADQNNPYINAALNFVTNPWVLAGLGGAAGYYFFGRKDGKTIEGKRPYVAAGVGAAAGLAAGKILQSYRTKEAAQVVQAQAQAQAQLQSQAQAAPQQGMDDYYMDSVNDIDVDSAFNQPPLGQPGVSQGEQGVPLQAEMEEPIGLGSLDGTSLGSNGLGSFSRDTGFDAYEDVVEEVLHETDRRRNSN